MKLNQKLSLSIATTILSLATMAVPSLAEQWYFKVQNATNSSIKKLLVSEDKKNWGYFNIGSGIAAGTTEKLFWDESTNSESCNQWIKAVYSDGSESQPSKINFCEDLDDPIVFE